MRQSRGLRRMRTPHGLTAQEQADNADFRNGVTKPGLDRPELRGEGSMRANCYLWRCEVRLANSTRYGPSWRRHRVRSEASDKSISAFDLMPRRRRQCQTPT